MIAKELQFVTTTPLIEKLVKGDLRMPKKTKAKTKTKTRIKTTYTKKADVESKREKKGLCAEVGDGMKGQGGVSWGCSKPPLLHQRSDTP